MEQLRNLGDANLTLIATVQSPIEFKRTITNPNAELVTRTRQEIRDILHGRDTRRLIMVVGPCSVHNQEEVLEYAQRLVVLKTQLEDDLLIIGRTYPEKPRTTIGWPGFIYDPELDDSGKADKGLEMSRRLLADINGIGLPCAVELLDPITPRYLEDLISWAAIGARSTEEYDHRKKVSGLSMPVGFKNTTEGNIQVAVDAMITARDKHPNFDIDDYGRVVVVRTRGNRDTHLILRGSSHGTNYDADSIQKAVNLLQAQNLLDEASRPVMIDCSHGNSTKDHKRQGMVAENVAEQFQTGQHRIMGMAIESYLSAGKQALVAGKSLAYGVSITDACIGLEETGRLLLNFAQKIRPRRFVMA